jgi:predicted double-glycine peptidase
MRNALLRRAAGKGRAAIGLGARLALLALAGTLLPLGAARAGEVTLGNGDTGNFYFRLTSYSEIPFRTVIRQQFDYSCGSAALATLLRFQYGLAMTESDAFKAMYAVGDQQQIQKLGFSLLDMKKYLASIGYQADGYRVSLADLAKAGVPAIALIQISSYKHFVVVKGVIGDQVLVGDPALGLRTFPQSDFQKLWNGIAFVIHDSPPGTRAPLFNGAEDWKHWAEFHPLSAATVIQPMTPLLRDLRVIYEIRPNFNLPSPFQN